MPTGWRLGGRCRHRQACERRPALRGGGLSGEESQAGRRSSEQPHKGLLHGGAAGMGDSWAFSAALPAAPGHAGKPDQFCFAHESRD